MAITNIPENQLCQAFDPFMIIPEKTVNIIDDPMKASTSCVAPASVYIEGTRGKRFLCDFHYAQEEVLTSTRRPDLWPAIAEYIVDEREKIKDTFDYSNDTNIARQELCWCSAPAFVLATNKQNGGQIGYCNFHFRKSFYRYLSNNVNFYDIYDVIDERKNMTMSIKEQVDALTQM